MVTCSVNDFLQPLSLTMARKGRYFNSVLQPTSCNHRLFKDSLPLSDLQVMPGLVRVHTGVGSETFILQSYYLSGPPGQLFKESMLWTGSSADLVK